MRITKLEGLPVFNAKKSITIEVTAKDIAKADIKEPDYCAVAVAVRRTEHAKEVRVHLGRVYVRLNDNNWLRFITPRSMRDEIVVFDRGGRFMPGEFTLSAPQPSKQKNKQQGSNKRDKTGKKRKPYRVLTDVRTGPTHDSE